MVISSCRDIKGSIDAATSADAALNLDPSPEMEYRVIADGDLLIKLPVDVNAELHLATVDGDEDSIHVDMPGVELAEGSPTQDITLGEGSAKIFLTAGHELIVTSKSEKWSSAADFGVGMSDFAGIPPIPPIPPIPYISGDFDLQAKINLKVEKALAKANCEQKGCPAEQQQRWKLQCVGLKPGCGQQRFEPGVVVSGVLLWGVRKSSISLQVEKKQPQRSVMMNALRS